MYPITNAISEGFNSKIQAIKSDARGFRRFANYRARILFHCGKLIEMPVRTLLWLDAGRALVRTVPGAAVLVVFACWLPPIPRMAVDFCRRDCRRRGQHRSF